MYKIDVPSAAGSLPTPAALGTEGFWTAGSPGVTAATILDQDWLNALQGNLINILDFTSTAHSKSDYTRLRTAIQALITANVSAETVNAQTGTTYTLLTGDNGKAVTFSNASSVAVTLPQAGSTGFAAGWWVDVKAKNGGAGAVITPTTSTIDGVASITLDPGQSGRIISDGTNYQWLPGAVGGSVIWVREEQTNGTNSADTMVVNTWKQRTLNTVKLNEIAGASLGSNQITLPPGTYEATVQAPVEQGGSINSFGRARLYNVTAGAEIVEGQSMIGLMGNSTGFNYMYPVIAKFTLTATSVLRVDCICSQADIGGTPCSLGGAEAYTEVYIRKLA